jgi:hypothetical protein
MLRSLVVVALALFAGLADGKNLYVNNSGTPACSDATTYAANTAAAPWCTIARAAWGSTTYASPVSAQGAAAGDVVLISAGTYWEDGTTSGGRDTVTLNPANSGTAGNVITFRGTSPVYIRLNNTYRGAMIGCDARNYIVWDTVVIDDYYGGSVSDTGPVVFTGGATYCQLINSTVIGHPGGSCAGSYYHGYATFCGNYRGVSCEPASNIRVYNNTIYGFRGLSNESGILTYDCAYSTFENNTIYDSGCGIFIKGDHAADGYPQIGNVIRKNLIYDTTDCGIRVLTGESTDVYQNIIKAGNGADAAGIWLGFGDALNSRIVNNTIYARTRQITGQDSLLSGILVYNNLIVNGGYAAIYTWNTTVPTDQGVTYNRNMYYNNPRIWYSESGTNLSLATFQGTYSQDVNGLDGTNPNFVDAAAGDFHLQAGSAALTLGRDYLNLLGGGTSATIPVGAYVTGSETIGAGAGALLSAPTNVRFRPRAEFPWVWLAGLF